MDMNVEIDVYIAIYGKVNVDMDVYMYVGGNVDVYIDVDGMDGGGVGVNDGVWVDYIIYAYIYVSVR